MFMKTRNLATSYGFLTQRHQPVVERWRFPSHYSPTLPLCAGKETDELLFGKHWRDWPCAQVKRICGLVEVPKVTAHGMRGALATFGLREGAPGHLVAAFLGQESDKTTRENYAEPDAAESAQRRKGWGILEGGKR